MSKQFDIDFWNSDTEKTFKKYRKYLLENSILNDTQIKEFLEGIYYTVASEFGE